MSRDRAFALSFSRMPHVCHKGVDIIAARRIIRIIVDREEGGDRASCRANNNAKTGSSLPGRWSYYKRVRTTARREIVMLSRKGKRKTGNQHEIARERDARERRKMPLVIRGVSNDFLQSANLCPIQFRSSGLTVTRLGLSFDAQTSPKKI